MVDFSLIPGGPFDDLLMRVGLLRPGGGATVRRAWALALIAWLPLAVLSAVQGRAWTGPGVPFFANYPEHVRFLIAVPLLVLVEPLVNGVLRSTLSHFRDTGTVSRAELPRLTATLDAAVKARDSRVAEFVLLLLAIAALNTTETLSTREHLGGWLLAPDSNGSRHSLAGYWFQWVAAPLYLFLMLRWLWRLLIWTRILARLSSMKLQLLATHPDRVGGLEFLPRGQSIFATVLFPPACVISATLSERIKADGTTLTSSAYVVALYVVLGLAMVVGPLCLFSPRLFLTKQSGLRHYGLLAERYVQQFDRKWIVDAAGNKDPLLGTPDISSLADLGTGFQVVREMRLFLVERRIFIALTTFLAAPFLPLLLAHVPLDELLKTLATLLVGR